MKTKKSKMTDSKLMKLAAKHGGNWIGDPKWDGETRKRYYRMCGPLVGRFYDGGCCSEPAYQSQVVAMTLRQLANAGFTPLSRVDFKMYPIHGCPAPRGSDAVKR